MTLLGHDSKIALFDLFKENNSLELSMRLDLDDLAIALAISPDFEPCEYAPQISDYILDRLKIKINDKAIDICISEQTKDEHYLEIKASLGITEYGIKQIDVWNTCLIDNIEDHSNIVHARIREKTRSFRMNKDRTSISIIYN